MQRLALSGILSRRGIRRTLNVNITGDDRDRTGNLRLAKPALSQLSYVPGPTPIRLRGPVGVLGFEPRTSALSELRSSQLSYTPKRVGLAARHPQKTKKAKPHKVWPYPHLV